MAASTTQNPAIRSESKSAKKKKAKAADVSTDSHAPSTPAPAPEAEPSNGAAESNNGDGSYESPYIKELYKSIRNVNKKITNASKVDNILAENPGKSLDELVASRKINADQKAQILKKPALQASLIQLEEQIAQYKKFDQEYKSKLQSEKAEWEKTYAERTSKEVVAAKAETEAAATAATKDREDNLLLLSQFLKLAAVRRSEEALAELEESKALEGLLAQVYTGDTNAVAAMLKLIQGSSDTLVSVEGEQLSTTYANLKEASAKQGGLYVEYEGSVAESVPAVESTEYPVQSDPTIANAGLTELDEPAASAALSNGEEAYDAHGIPQNSGFGDGAANAAAEANWDNNNDLSTSQEWVEVPRDATETDTGVTGTPAAPSNVQSWADDQPDSPAQEKTPVPQVNANDGFHEVQRSRGGKDNNNRGPGQYRGRGRGGDGRGGRGAYRGEGGYRGGRGGRGGARGGRRTDEASS